MCLLSKFENRKTAGTKYQPVFQVILPDLLHDGSFPEKRPLLYTTKEWVLWYYYDIFHILN